MKWFLWAALVLPGWEAAAETSAAIRIDQVGYLPDGPKLAMVASGSAEKFEVRAERGGAVAYSGTLDEPERDENSGDLLRMADFSDLRRPGRYVVYVPGVGESYPFEIGAAIYRRPYQLAMRFFYGQRCGMAVDPGSGVPAVSSRRLSSGGGVARLERQSGRARESAKGWHDAGDYGRYVVNSGISTGTLLWAWEMFSGRIRPVSLQIPESGRSTPDILSEIRWNLEWMLGMQDDDGGVFHKQTSEQFPGFVMPDADRLVSYVMGTGTPPYKGTCATADLCLCRGDGDRRPRVPAI